MPRATAIPSPPPADIELVQRCVAGERAARDELVTRYGRLVYATIARTLGRHDRTADEARLTELFANTFVALIEEDCRRLTQWDGRCALASWVRLVAASTTLDALRVETRSSRLQAQGVDIERLPLDGQDALDRAIRAERLVRLEGALERLATSDRDLLDLLFRQDVPPGEVARRLGVDPGALYTRKNRAIERLRRAYAALGGPDDEGKA